MRQDIRLYIDGHPADCDSSSLILMNYTREELDNPAILRNSYSQTITLPATAANERIFTKYVRNDYRTTVGNFNAASRVPFVIMNAQDEVLESGYIRLISVASRGRSVGSYSVQLYGGLGGFFYGLRYNADGSERTLADIHYVTGTIERDPNTTSYPMTAQSVGRAWQALKGGSYDGTLYGLVNFAPAYNGKPSCKFSTDRGVYSGTSISNNLYMSDAKSDSQGVTQYYGTRSDVSSILVQLGGEHNEWEVQDLRAYLQRPVMRVRDFLRACTLQSNSSGYAFKVDSASGILTDPYILNGWVTLPMFDRDNIDPTTATLADILRHTCCPAALLISLAKTFGFIFGYESATKTITLYSRNKFYDTGLATIDLTSRIDVSEGIDITPYSFAHRFYELSNPETYGEFAAAYAERYGRAYGSMTIDTSYAFDNETEQIVDADALKGAADVVETSPWYRVVRANKNAQEEATEYQCKFAFGEDIHWLLYNMAGTDDTLECKPRYTDLYTMSYSSRAGYDFMAKPQLHGEDDAPQDGSGVLLFFNGMQSVPTRRLGTRILMQARFVITNDNADMLALNDGIPCWHLLPYTTGMGLDELPSFRRWHIVSGSITHSMDYGVPKEVQGIEETPDASSCIYTKKWSAYYADRFNVDSRIMHCKCNLRGLQVGQELLRRFFWFDGSIWVLNKITNHSLTTNDATECEFVRVMAENAYKIGQN